MTYKIIVSTSFFGIIQHKYICFVLADHYIYHLGITSFIIHKLPVYV
jgi:hypothetical protein